MATQSLPDPQATCRRKFQGRRISLYDMAREAVKLRAQMPVKAVARRLGYGEVKSVYNLLKYAEAWGIAAAAAAPNIPAAAQYDDPEMRDFLGDPLVAKWVKEMASRGHGGKPLKGARSLVRQFEVICRTTGTRPSQWLAGEGRDDILEFARATMASFMEAYMAGKSAHKYPKGWSAARADEAAVAFSYGKAARNFLLTHGYTMPRGEKSKLAASVIPFHGLYNEVRMSEAEFRAAKDYAASRFGIDSDAYRWFAVGIEGLPRASALFNMTTEYEEVKTASGTLWLMSARETKTEHFNGGKWPKYIHGKRTKEAIEAAAKRGRHVIVERNRKAVEATVYPALREIYHEVGLDKKHLIRPDDPASAYVLKHPSHALRHIGAQRWLRLTNWNIEFVASMGWRSPAELTASYGAMPAEERLKLLGGLTFG